MAGHNISNWDKEYQIILYDVVLQSVDFRSGILPVVNQEISDESLKLVNTSLKSMKNLNHKSLNSKPQVYTLISSFDWAVFFVYKNKKEEEYAVEDDSKKMLIAYLEKDKKSMRNIQKKLKGNRQDFDRVAETEKLLDELCGKESVSSVSLSDSIIRASDCKNRPATIYEEDSKFKYNDITCHLEQEFGFKASSKKPRVFIVPSFKYTTVVMAYEKNKRRQEIQRVDESTDFMNTWVFTPKIRAE